MPKALAAQFPYMNNVAGDLRLLGMPSILNPFAQHTSSSRANMLSSHVPQAMIIKGCEFPQLFTGVEYDFGQYEFNTSRRDQDAEILAVIPRYSTAPVYNGTRIKSSPYLTVIYLGLEDRLLHCFTVEKYTKGTDGFGYENTWLNTHLLYSNMQGSGNSYLPKDTVLVTSPAHKGAQYCLGTNLNTAYMTMMDTIDDAMVISESAAAKFETLSIATVLVNINQASRPVNLYGDENEVRFMPDIGEVVGPHGFLCALRAMHTDTFTADLDTQALLTPQETDEVTLIEAGALITDIEFVSHPSQRNFGAYGAQMEKYNTASRAYWDKILEIHQQYSTTYQLSKEFSTLVTTAIKRSLMLSPSKRIPGLKLKEKRFDVEGFIRKQTVDFIQVMVTYVKPRPFNKAFKISDRHGTKGVTPRICPDNEMPTDAHGIRADVVIDPASPVARMNFGQLHEASINRTSMFVQRRCAEVYPVNPMQAAEILLEWYNDVNPNYAALVRSTLNDEDLILHVKEAIDTRIHIHIPPFLQTLLGDNAPRNVAAWSDKWGAAATPVTYSLHDRHGVKHTYTTKYPVAIEAKYMICLAKLPYATSAGIAYVSHYGLPIKPGGNTKHKFATRMSPIRLGEDENRLMCMDVPENEVVRLNNLLSNSPYGTDLMISTMLNADHPTAIGRIAITDEDLARTSSVTAMFHHTTAVLGIETRKTLTTILPPAGLRNDSLILGNNEGRLGSGFSDGWDGAERDAEKWLSKLPDDADEIADDLLDDTELELLPDAVSAELELADEVDAILDDLSDIIGEADIEPVVDSDNTNPLHDANLD